MVDIKLTYFDARGRAETSRLILAYAGVRCVEPCLAGTRTSTATITTMVRYTDQRLTGEQFASVKGRLPWGQLPTIKYNGTMITQSIAIARLD
jgi:glutathione S-transferase